MKKSEAIDIIRERKEKERQRGVDALHIGENLSPEDKLLSAIFGFNEAKYRGYKRMLLCKYHMEELDKIIESIEEGYYDEYLSHAKDKDVVYKELTSNMRVPAVLVDTLGCLEGEYNRINSDLAYLDNRYYKKIDRLLFLKKNNVSKIIIENEKRIIRETDYQYRTINKLKEYLEEYSEEIRERKS